jgi:uncharacterized protein YjbI with pentapeptide repeats
MDFTTEQIYVVASVVFFMLGLLALGISLAANRNQRTIASDVSRGFSTEMFAAILTTIVLGLLITSSQTNEVRKDLILEMGSPNNDFANEAARKLRARGWLTDGSLQGASLQEADLTDVHLENADLQGANLARAILVNADLRGAVLIGADLQGANLEGANLEGTNLQNAILEGANLRNVNLQDANLEGANLQNITFSTNSFIGANLTRANLSNLNLFRATMDDAILCGTNLQGANLQGVNLENNDLEQAVLDANTILPDGQSWSEEIFQLVEC